MGVCRWVEGGEALGSGDDVYGVCGLLSGESLGPELLERPCVCSSICWVSGVG